MVVVKVSIFLGMVMKQLALGILICIIQQCCADYYTTLGVKRDATTKEIRSAFKKLALSSHPDKNKVGWQDRLFSFFSFS